MPPSACLAQLLQELGRRRHFSWAASKHDAAPAPSCHWDRSPATGAHHTPHRHGNTQTAPAQSCLAQPTNCAHSPGSINHACLPLQHGGGTRDDIATNARMLSLRHTRKHTATKKLHHYDTEPRPRPCSCHCRSTMAATTKAPRS
ncbi:unnamed protein product [Coccothraustes coccothraustes]